MRERPDRSGGPAPLTRLRRDGLRLLSTGRFYRHTLIGRVPADLRLRVGQRWPGDPRRGAALLAGDIELAGELVRNPAPVWFPAATGTDWLAAWHGFGWMPDLIVAGGSAREIVRALLQSWLADNIAWHPVAWRSDVVATRIFAWIVHFDEIASREADQPLRRAMLASLVRQLRHLGRTATWELTGPGRLRALKGLIAGLAVLGGAERRITRAVRALERELPAQILPDGGHRSRSPSLQLQVLRDLIDTRAMLRAAHFDIPPVVQETIERMAPMLRFFRHGDRRLALFNNATEEDGVLVDLVLTRSETKGRAPSQALQSGFQRLQAGSSLVVVDTGKPAAGGADEYSHAGVLSFEMSHGRDRIIVNCGAYRGPKPAWHRVTRASAAHSVLVVEDTNAIEIQGDGRIGRPAGVVNQERAEDGGHQWIVASHDFYRERFGLNYSRQLFLAAGGEDLRGEDTLTGRAGAAFAVRFHLHPAVQASLAQDSAAALLRLPGGGVWRLRAAGAEMSLGESVYLGAGEVRKTQQVVLSGRLAGGVASIRWAIRREANAGDAP